MTDEEPLEEYLSRINQELAERQSRLEALDREISEIRYQLSKHKMQLSLLRGDAGVVKCEETYRQKLRGALKLKQEERIVVLEDLKRAVERSQSAQSDLNRLLAGENV